jgi:hypothetical protein
MISEKRMTAVGFPCGHPFFRNLPPSQNWEGEIKEDGEQLPLGSDESSDISKNQISKSFGNFLDYQVRLVFRDTQFLFEQDK